MNPIIETSKLSKTFSVGGTQQHVLVNLDLRIEAGDFTVIMGPSGSGKSTLLYTLSGMDRPSLGRIRFLGTDITGYSENRLARFRRSHCGFVFQQIHLLDSLSVFDNLMVLGLLVGRNRRAVAERARQLLTLVGLFEQDYRKFPSMLSGGEAQRVGIARALINSPAVCFADEPTGPLNHDNTDRVLNLLTGIHRDGQSIVLVTHDPHVAARGSRVLYLRDGGVVDELVLGRYQGDDHARSQHLNGFLTKMGW